MKAADQSAGTVSSILANAAKFERAGKLQAADRARAIAARVMDTATRPPSRARPCDGPPPGGAPEQLTTGV